MALTRESELRLRKARLIEFFEANRSPWIAIAQRTYKFLKGEFPDAMPPRQDDVAQNLIPILAVSESFTAQLDAKRLTGKFWNRLFAELIIDREWDRIRGANQ